MKDKLTTVREALQYYASNCDSKTICTNGKIYPFKAQVALALIDEIIATMDSPQLVQKVARAIYEADPATTGDGMGEIVSIEFDELYQSEWEKFTDEAQAAINTIKDRL